MTTRTTAITELLPRVCACTLLPAYIGVLGAPIARFLLYAIVAGLGIALGDAIQGRVAVRQLGYEAGFWSGLTLLCGLPLLLLARLASHTI